MHVQHQVNRSFCALVLLPWKLLKFAAISRIKNVFSSNFRTFPNFSKCKALGDFLISFLEIVHLRGCLGGTSQNSNFYNWFEILDIFRHWLLNSLSFPRSLSFSRITIVCLNSPYFGLWSLDVHEQQFRLFPLVFCKWYF